MGSPNASQKRTNRAAFSLASMLRVPASSWLIRDNSDGFTFDSSKPDDDVRRKRRLYLKE